MDNLVRLSTNALNQVLYSHFESPRAQLCVLEINVISIYLKFSHSEHLLLKIVVPLQ